MNKAIQALLTGMFITFILDFFLFLGILLNYIDFYKVDLYYNILFADNQNGYLFFGLSIVLGFLVVYLKNYKISLVTVAILSVAALSTLTEGIGRSVGESMFMTKNTTIKTQRYLYVGDIIYDGRQTITFYDYNFKKTVVLEKKDLIK
ncbi:hypothetical protein [Sulfurimonas sp.]|uniref:hypothetical protein n=1 Tax=Sulfurimonas sp. TaxID=2022749 RepID=UPI0025F2121A|nr:hypothetical protein [Sulfurimonas sp.]MBW6488230.1 hypothetical protein [Sulfurimonas sp.]